MNRLNQMNRLFLLFRCCLSYRLNPKSLMNQNFRYYRLSH